MHGTKLKSAGEASRRRALDDLKKTNASLTYRAVSETTLWDNALALGKNVEVV